MIILKRSDLFLTTQVHRVSQLVPPRAWIGFYVCIFYLYGKTHTLLSLIAILCQTWNKLQKANRITGARFKKSNNFKP